MNRTIDELKKIHVMQLGEFACGLACLSALTKYYGGDIPQEQLRQTSGTTLNGTSLLGLYQAAQKIGFDARGYEADTVYLKTMDHPVILHVVMDNKREHFIICYGYRDNRFVIGDPGWGITFYSEDELEAVWQSHTLLSLVPNDKFRKKDDFRKDQRTWFISLIREDIPILLVAMVLGILMALTGLSTAIFSQKLIDEFLPNMEKEKIAIGLVALGLLLCMRAFLGYVQGIFMARQGRDLNVRVVKSFVDKIIHLPVHLLKGYSTGDLVARMNDSMRIRNSVSLVTGNLAINLLVVLVSTGYIFFLSWHLGLLCLSGMLLFLIVGIRFHRPILNLQREVMVAHAHNESQYLEALTGIRTVRSYGKERVFKDRIGAVYGLYQGKSYDLAILGNRFGFFTQLVVGLYISLMFAYGVWMVMEARLLLGELMAMLTVGGAIIPGTAALVISNIQLQEAKVAFSRLYEIASLEKENPEGEESSRVRSGKSGGILQLESVAFRFAGRRSLLKDIRFTLGQGETVALFGQVGTGKSTLAEIIQGVYRTESGFIGIDGRSMAQWTLPEWRKQVSLVSQTEKIFNTSVLDNICLSNDPQELMHCQAFVREAGFDRFFSRLQQGLLTLCGEDGGNLSGGQRQLVAIARALYRKPRFLVLDEATSAMDFDTEKKVISLLKQRKEMGMMMITHRLGLARQSERILVLKDGRIAHSGPHSILANGQNEYAEAYAQIVSETIN